MCHAGTPLAARAFAAIWRQNRGFSPKGTRAFCKWRPGPLCELQPTRRNLKRDGRKRKEARSPKAEPVGNLWAGQGSDAPLVFTPCRLPVGDTADCQSALRRGAPAGNSVRRQFCLPYRRLATCGRRLTRTSRSFSSLPTASRRYSRLPACVTAWRGRGGARRSAGVRFRISFGMRIWPADLPSQDTAGRVKKNVAPFPGSLSTRTSPPCACTMCLTMDSPSPVPP